MIVIKTDVGGVYKWNPANQEWIWLTRTLDWIGPTGIDVESVALDRSLPNRVYAVFPQRKPFLTPWNSTNYKEYGEVLFTDNDGLTWTPTGLLELQVPIAGNGDYRTNTGERLVVDPRRSGLLYFASRTSGLLRRDLNTNTTWSVLGGGLPPADSLDAGKGGSAAGRAGFTFVAFDGRSASSVGPSPVIYTGAYGKGVYLSKDAGQTWQILPDPSGRNRFPLRAAVASDGVLWTAFEASQGAPALRRYDPQSGAWADVVFGNGTLTEVTALALDPTNPNRLSVGGSFAGRNRSLVLITRDPIKQTFSATPHTVLRQADPSIPEASFAANQPDYYFNEAASGPAGLAFDPANPARLFQTNGFGVIVTDNCNLPQPVWNWRRKGLEELVATSVKVPQSGAVQLYSAHMDMIGFRHLNRDQTPTMADRLLPFGHAVNPDYVVGSGWYGWVPFATYSSPRWPDGHVTSAIGLDISAKNPNFLAFTGMHQWTAPWGISGFSTDAGASWKPFPSIPTERMRSTRWLETPAGQWVSEDVDRDLKAVGGVIAVGAAISPNATTPPMIWLPKTMGQSDRLLTQSGNPYLAATTALGRLYYWDPATQTWGRSRVKNPDPRPADGGDANQQNLYRFFDSPPLSWANSLAGPATVPYNYANVVAADRTDSKIFYYLADGSGTRNNAWARLYASLDGGKTFEEIFYGFESISGGASIAWSPRPALIPHPTRRGELWIAFGSNPELDSRPPLFRATLNGSTWTLSRVATLANADMVAFGKGAAGAPPAIYAKGRTPGMTRDSILQSLDDGQTWRAISDPSQESFPGALGLEGDMRTENLIYIYSAGRGVSYGTLAPAPATPGPQYDFETGTMDWTLSGTGPQLTASLSQSAPGAPALSGTRSLELTLRATGTATQNVFLSVDPRTQQPAPGKTITFRLQLPPGAPLTGIGYIQDGKWNWTGATALARTSQGWQTATLNVPLSAALPLNRLGVAIQVRGTWTGKVYIDAVSW